MPQRPFRICPKCKGRINTARCPACEKKRQPQRDTKTAAERKFYGSGEWKRIRARQLKREPLCRTCLAAGRIRAGNTVDHITPMRDDGSPRDPANLQTQCATCHQQKRQREAMERRSKAAR